MVKISSILLMRRQSARLALKQTNEQSQHSPPLLPVSSPLHNDPSQLDSTLQTLDNPETL